MADAAAHDAAALEWACVALDSAVTMAANGGDTISGSPTDLRLPPNAGCSGATELATVARTPRPVSAK